MKTLPLPMGDTYREEMLAREHGALRSTTISDLWGAVSMARQANGDIEGAGRAADQALWAQPQWQTGKIR
jgi:hypothetical protein